MPPTLESIKLRTRLELGDASSTFQASVVGDGSTTRFDLPVGPVERTGFAAYLLTDPIETLEEPGDYVLESDTGVITLTNPAPAGVTLLTQGTNYKYFSDAEIETFVLDAFIKHVNDQIPPISLEDPTPAGYVPLPDVEEHLVALLAAIEGLWVLATDAAFDIDILTPEGVSIPRSQRFAQLMSLIQMLEERYRKLAEALNVGLSRVQMFNLRRISRTTNRYVPVYVAQEVDDRTAPVRVYPPIDPGI